MEDTRRRGFAFEKLAKVVLRFLEKSEKVKVGISELQERREVPVQIGISTQQVAQQVRSENGQKIFESLLARRGRGLCCQLARWDAQLKGLVELERTCQETSQEIQNVE